MRKINLIVVHCTATRALQPFSVADVDRWHRQRGFDEIGYHFLITLDGRVEPGRDIRKPGAHARGYNAHSIGVAYVGGLDSNGQPADTRTPAQRAALLSLLRKLKSDYPEARILGHRDLAAKACPCFDATKEYAAI